VSGADPDRVSDADGCSPETKGRTLEEIKEIFDGEALQTAEAVRTGGIEAITDRKETVKHLEAVQV
jgi:hypothetical protein